MKPGTGATLMILFFLFSHGALSCGPKDTGPTVPPPSPPVLKPRACGAFAPSTNVQVSDAIGESNNPVVRLSKDAFSVAYWDLRGRYPQVRTFRVDRQGVLRAPDRLMPSEGVAKEQSLAFDGSRTQLVYRDGERVVDVSADADDPTPLVLSEHGASPSAGGYGAAAWVEDGVLLFRCDGMLPLPNRQGVVGPALPIPLAQGGIEDTSIAWTGAFFAVAWSASTPGGREIRLQRVAHDGRLLGDSVKVSGTVGMSRKPVLAWTGKDFVVAWTQAAPSAANQIDKFRVFLALVPEVGSSPRLTRQLDIQGSADRVALATTGRELGLAWVGSKGAGSGVYFRPFGLDGAPRGETIEVTDGSQIACGRPDIAWGGDGYAVVWHDDRATSGSEVFFSFLACQEPSAAGSTDAAPAKPADTSAPPSPSLKDAF
jgi:hypothetical protein